MAGNGVTATSLQDALKGVTAYGNRAADLTIDFENWSLTIRALPSSVANYIEALKDEGEQRYQILRFGIVGWERLKDKSGAAIEFKQGTATLYGKGYSVVDRDLMDAIPTQLWDPIAEAIGTQTFLTQTEQQVQDFTPPPPAKDASGAAKAKATKSTESVTPVGGET